MLAFFSPNPTVDYEDGVIKEEESVHITPSEARMWWLPSMVV
jgi:hypothetical protein